MLSDRGGRTSWYCICWISSLNTRGYIQRLTAVGAPDGEQAESNGMATFTQTLKHCTHIHTNLKQIRGGGCSSYNVYSNKLCYQLMTDVSDCAGCVKHSQQEPTGMNKLHAGNDWKDCIFSIEWKEEERSGECRTLVWPMRMQQVHSNLLWVWTNKLTWMSIFPKQTDGVLSSAMNMIPWK